VEILYALANNQYLHCFWSKFEYEKGSGGAGGDIGCILSTLKRSTDLYCLTPVKDRI